MTEQQTLDVGDRFVCRQEYLPSQIWLSLPIEPLARDIHSAIRAEFQSKHGDIAWLGSSAIGRPFNDHGVPGGDDQFDAINVYPSPTKPGHFILEMWFEVTQVAGLPYSQSELEAIGYTPPPWAPTNTTLELPIAAAGLAPVPAIGFLLVLAIVAVAASAAYVANQANDAIQAQELTEQMALEIGAKNPEFIDDIDELINPPSLIADSRGLVIALSVLVGVVILFRVIPSNK